MLKPFIISIVVGALLGINAMSVQCTNTKGQTIKTNSGKMVRLG